MEPKFIAVNNSWTDISCIVIRMHKHIFFYNTILCRMTSITTRIDKNIFLKNNGTFANCERSPVQESKCCCLFVHSFSPIYYSSFIFWLTRTQSNCDLRCLWVCWKAVETRVRRQCYINLNKIKYKSFEK